MTTDHKALCERLREHAADGDWPADTFAAAADLIEAQAKQIAEFQAQLERSEKAVIFAGLVLKEHRNDGYPGDVDGDFLQSAALLAGLIEERTVNEPCCESCTCAEATMPADFPVVCYFNTEAGKAAIEAANKGERG